MTGAPLSRRAVLGLGVVAGGLAAGGGATAFGFSSAMREARDRVSADRSTVISSRFGDLEYAEAGAGPPILVIHGSGGGFDQGLFFARRLVQAGYRVIAPSRFGYLRSSFPDDPSSENQADAYVDLLDALSIESLPIIGGSAGALSAVQFAIRHRDRCLALLPVVPIGYAPGRPAATPSALQQAMLETILGSDFLFWLLRVASPDTLTEMLLATDPGLIRAASSVERERIAEVLSRILPVSHRNRGLLNDTSHAMGVQPVALSAIAVPTLVISAEDDKFGTAENARALATGIAGAELIIYPAGGHMYVGHHDELFASAIAFLERLGYGPSARRPSSAENTGM